VAAVVPWFAVPYVLGVVVEVISFVGMTTDHSGRRRRICGRVPARERDAGGRPRRGKGHSQAL
jgi:hypothetical protein